MVLTGSSSKHKTFWFLSLWFILTQTFPPINLLLPIPGVLHFPIFIGITMLLFPKLMFKKSMVCLYAYIGFAFLFFLTGNDYYGKIGRVTNPLLDMGAGLLIAEYVLKYDTNYRYTRWIIYVVIISNVIMSIISIPKVYLFPNIIRISSKEYAADIIDYTGLKWLISYQTCHGLPFLFAPLILLCRNMLKINKRLFFFWCVSTIILCYILYLSNATTALLISILFIAMGLFSEHERFSSRSLLFLALGGLMIIIISSTSILIPILDFVQGNMDESWSNYHKLEDIKQQILYGSSEGDVEARGTLYETSFKLFLESPIIGTTRPQDISHHSWFLDNLACFGIILILPLVLILFNNVKSIYKNLRHSKVAYVYGVAAWFLMLILKNEFGQGTWLYGFAFLPLICRYIDYMKDNNLTIIIKK